MRLLLRQAEKVITIARNHQSVFAISIGQYLNIGRGPVHNLANENDDVAKFPQKVRQVIRHIVIEQEFHCSPAAIWRATKRSISPL